MTRWLAQTPTLAALDSAARSELAKLSPTARPAGETIFTPGSAAQAYAIVVSGRVDVTLTGISGREILLYSIEPGQSCIQSTIGLMGDSPYSAEAQTVKDTELVLVPKSLFLTLLNQSEPFRTVVFHAFAARMQTMVTLLEKVAFQRVECRLAERLLELADGTSEINMTQADLATQIGTAREVISRRLEAWSKRGWIRQSRGQITLLDRDALFGLSIADM